ncbi:MAG TPA: glycoside hydrolase family 3 C-terminal domain-containing protein, partial [Candidatus Acidoferrum sp.]|nr:glycoside hydrolase family 3 C-terminal domain-containing protein [Candidatus Acidoferrum sp.]
MPRILLLLLASWLCCSSRLLAADVDGLLAQMTLDEKLALLHGQPDPDPATGLNSAGYLPGVPRLGIPPLRLADGPAGIRTDAPATAMPAPVMLAASFDRALARRYGAVLGREGVARHQQILLSPMINMVRVPQAGRNFETLGEDPLLAGELVAAEIGGIQSQGMMATVKHFAANNQEQDRLTINAGIDERVLREIYLPAFEAAVRAGVASVMCAYNQVNGQYSCDNAWLLQQVLRNEWGFQGFVMTDWWAMHTLTAIHSGLNLEMPGWAHPEYPVLINFDEPLRAAVNDGSIKMATVDAAVRPLLLMMDRFGWLDGKLPAAADNAEDSHAAALDTAVAGAVLLKNANAALPLDAAALNDTVIFGPTSATTLVGGGGSSRVLPATHDDALTALRTLGHHEVRWQAGYDLDGITVPGTALRVPDKAVYGVQLVEHADVQRTVPTIDYTLHGAGVRTWKGELVAPETGKYYLYLQTDGPTASLYHDDERVVFNDGGVPSQATLLPTSSGLRNSVLPLQLAQGEHYRFRVEAWTGDDKPVRVRLAWLTPSQRAATIKRAVDAAAKAANVVVFAHVEGTETADRATLALPGYQDELIHALATQTQAKVSVVLNTGAPVLMPWVDEVAAILQLWYPGQAGGEATARLLLGLDNPSGKLPVSFPRSEGDSPVTEP